MKARPCKRTPIPHVPAAQEKERLAKQAAAEEGEEGEEEGGAPKKAAGGKKAKGPQVRRAGSIGHS